MARSAIPDFGVEYPPYEYKPFPRYVGSDELGEAIIAKDEKEYEALKGTEYFPRVMGKDKAGRDVIAQIPRDLEWLKGQVVTPPEDPAVVAKREADAKAAEAETKRKAEAYDKLMAAQDAASNPPPVDSGSAQNALTAPTGLKKSKAA
jgi:hypothetical protein